MIRAADRAAALPVGLETGRWRVHAVRAVLLAVFLVELVRTAWISDDAAITLRTVLNFVHGFGPTFNVGERVQAYTHPLWFLLLSGASALLGNPFAATFALSIAVSALVLWLLVARVATHTAGAVVAAAACLLSRAFVDFSTSGLENPLAHLLLLCSVLLALRAAGRRDLRSLALFAISGAILYLTRPDVPLLLLPLAAWVAWRNRHQPGVVARAAALGLVPVIAWTAFATFYYGFPLPNTAYAKLGAGVPTGERIVQGLRYCAHAVGTDPLTVAFILVGAAVGATSAPGLALSAGMALYVAYVIWIGGDFMAGRLFTFPFLVAAVQVARAHLGRAMLAAVGGSVAVLGAAGLHATLLSDSSYTDRRIPPDGIADERGFYFRSFGMLAAPAGTFSTPRWSVEKRPTVIVCNGLGFHSIALGPGSHHIDTCGLADPLLARLPARFDPHWRIGHFERQLPTGYPDSIELGTNQLVDPEARAYYEAIRTITRGPLWSAARLREIVRMNLGLRRPPDGRKYRYDAIPRSLRVQATGENVLRTPVEAGPWDAPGNVTFSNALEIVLDLPTSFREIDLSVDNNDTYRIEALAGGRWVELTTIQPQPAPGMVRHRVELPGATPTTDRIRITAVAGDGMYSVGHLLLR